VHRGRVTLRPHAKTHKSAWIAGKQIAAGAMGCVARNSVKLRRFRGRCPWNSLTSPVVDSTVPRRLCDVAAVDPEFMCAVDYPDPVTALGLEATSRGVTVKVIIDVDVGLMRTGVSGDGAALRLPTIRRHPSRSWPVSRATAVTAAHRR
jgi:D-serine deaminase-like pyridoxal phosphate-dependent protein